jgi:transcriptional regulator with XRE-family HTH domain
MDTGNKIKHFRLLKGFSQEKMAELLGIAPKSYGNIERNITDVNLSRLQQIADTLEVSLPRLLDFDEKNIIQGNNNLNHSLNHSPNSTIYTSDQMLAQENQFLK